MKGLIEYSALSAKVRAMSKHILDEEEYKKITSYSTIPELVLYLKKHESYSVLFNSVDEHNTHRGQIEGLLLTSVYNDFIKLYQFAGMNQKGFLEVYMIEYETKIIKKCLRTIFDEKNTVAEDIDMGDFFKKHSKLNAEELSKCKTIEELRSSLKGTPYYQVLRDAQVAADVPSIFEYENALDKNYFKVVWKLKNKKLVPSERKIIENIYGTKIDLYNFQWIHRGKKYYRIKSEHLRELLIPIGYKIQTDEMYSLAHAENKEVFNVLMKKNFYGRKYAHLMEDQENFEKIHNDIIKRRHVVNKQNHPYSIAIVIWYLYMKKTETENIVKILEGIRYGLDPERIMHLIV